VARPSLADEPEIYLPPLHIKRGLIRNICETDVKETKDLPI
jgi:hypothetical protein